jgi:formylglycine-generating enzyme required for sulfatase activity
MINTKKCNVIKFIVILLVLLIGLGETISFSQHHEDQRLSEALSDYKKGDYDEAVDQLKTVLNTGGDADRDRLLKARIYFLLGACYEKLKDKKSAKAYFVKLRDMFEKGEIEGFSSMGGIAPNSLSTYKKVFKDYFKKRERERSKASRNVIAKQASKSKKKRKGALWVAAVAGVAALITILILATKKKPDAPEPPTFEYEPIEWMRVPAGEFLMGDNFGDGLDDQRPVHSVFLDEYYISRYEITATQYSYYLQETGRNKGGTNMGSGQFPVVNVTWEEANDFCEWLSQKTGENIKLPTESQWEKAARGTDQRKYPWGNNEPNCQLGNFGDCGNRAKVVGSVPDGRSPYGVEDMAGNVSEWCRDWYDSAYYSLSPYNNPQGPEVGINKAVRGSNYFYSSNSGSILHSSYRWNFEPDQISARLGFRVVKE